MTINKKALKKATDWVLHIAAQSKAVKRKVGAAILDSDGVILVSGCNYNRADGPCEVNGKTVTTVVHAEVAAIEQLAILARNTKDRQSIKMPLTILCTFPPCDNCNIVIRNANIEKVIIIEEFIKYDKNKLRYDLITSETLQALATVLTYGAKKYKPNNWKQSGTPDRFVAAFFRHFEAWRLGEDIDPDSGFPHLDHALTNLSFIQYLDNQSKENHDH